MYIRFLFLFGFTFLSATVKWSISDNIDFGTVIFANVLYRHGDRTPVEPYPNDPYNNESLWPVPYGQLTNLGKHQHLLHGRWLRKRYAHLLTHIYSRYDIYVKSTDVDRTLMSAEANLAGLYPPKGNDIWDSIKWMPIPVHTIPQEIDNVLAAKKNCPRYEYELKKVLQSPEIKRINKENEKLYAYLTEKTGLKVEDFKTVEHIYDTLFIENLYNMTLPEWTKDVFPNKLKPLATKSFTIAAYNKILQRLKTGLLLGEMVDHMKKKADHALTPDRKMWIYSAHDETVANVLMALDLFEPHCPPYTATIFIELRINSKKQYFVTISYKNSSAEPMLLRLPNCVTLCPLSQFITLMNDIVPEDWEKECTLEWEKCGYYVNTTTIIAMLASSMLMLIVLVLMIVGFVYWYQKRENTQYYLRLTTDPI